MIDAHQHFWRYAPATHGWIDARMGVLKRDFLPAELEPILALSGYEGCVAVQAAQTLEETRFLLALAAANPFVLGVVGWVDLCAPDVATELAGFARDPRFVGVRHCVQEEPDPAFLARPEFLRGITALARFDLAYDVLVYEHQLPAVIDFVARFPEQRFVLDHLGKPRVRDREREPWAARLAELARHRNVSCKLSGLATEADWAHWTADDLAFYVDAALASFGPERLMIGSDWPVCLLAGSHASVTNSIQERLRELSARERAAVLGGTARSFYRLCGTGPNDRTARASSAD